MIIKSTKKLLHINGDHYNEKKTTMKIYKQLKLEIKKRYYLEEIFIDDSYLNFINNCIGCKTCFKTGNCIYDNKDGIIEIKNKLLGADIIVISTPIFIDNISGNLKTLFDRLSYWFHTMPLKGKKCILIISTYRTGINEVSNYLNKIFVETVGTIKKCDIDAINEAVDLFFDQDEPTDLIQIFVANTIQILNQPDLLVDVLGLSVLINEIIINHQLDDFNPNLWKMNQHRFFSIDYKDYLDEDENQDAYN